MLSLLQPLHPYPPAGAATEVPTAAGGADAGSLPRPLVAGIAVGTCVLLLPFR